MQKDPWSAARCLVAAFVAALLAPLAFSAEETTNLSLPTDRTLGAKFAQLPELIQKGNFNEVTQFLGGLLGGTDESSPAQDMFFLPEGRAEQALGMKVEVQRMLGSLPEKGRAAYQLQFGARAEKLLAAAIESGRMEDLEEVSRRFFHTDAGYQASFLLGVLHLDQGHPLAAAQLFQMLLDSPAAVRLLEPGLSLRAATSWLWSGKPERAREILVKWKEASGLRSVTLGGDSVSLFTNPEDAVIWLSKLVGEPILAQASKADSWTMYRGTPARNGETLGGMPLFATRWRVRVADDPAIERLITGLENIARQRQVALIPALHPLAIGNTIVTRSARDLVAIDFETGKRLWEVHPKVEDGFDRVIKSGHNSNSDGEEGSPLVDHLGRRMWDDAVYGSFCSDGERVFAVLDLSLELGESYPQGMFFVGPQQEEEKGNKTNRLAALSLAERGKTLWEAGGSDSADETLRDAFFLGAPLLLDGQLYALAEIKGGIRLVVLEATTGKQVWSQQLADVEFNVSQHKQRRLAGATPSYSDGVLICPIGAGAVVAVDIVNRALRWAYRYSEKEDVYGGRGIFGNPYETTSERENDRWVDNSATIVDDKVILTPVESNRLYCLNLFDGSPVWEAKRRSDNLYVACVQRGKIILVGTEHLTALNLSDGSQAWPDGMLTLPDGSLPSGRGFQSGEFYYLPLSSAEVAKIDLTAGKLVQRVKSRDGHIPGNLICHQQMVLSQSADYLYKYFQLEPLETWVKSTLATNPQDPVALLRLGQLKLEQGAADEAVQLLRTSHQQAAQQGTPKAVQSEAREMFVQGLLEGLRTNFAKNREFVSELRPLIDQPDQKSALLRLQAAGLQQLGELDAALNTYLELIALDDPLKAGLEVIAPGHLAQRDRWLAAQLTALYESAAPAIRQRINTAISARLDSILSAGKLPELRSALTSYPFHPRRVELAFLLSDRLVEGGRMLEAELTLEELLASASRGSLAEEALQQAQAGAAARLAQIMAQAGHYDQAAHWAKQLESHWPEVATINGKLGKEVVASWPAKLQQGTRAAQQAKIWLPGEVKAAVRAGTGEHVYRNSRPLELRGPRNPFYEQTSLALDQQPLSVVGFDARGAKRFTIPLYPPDHRHEYEVDPATSSATSKGNLLLVSMGNEIVALDTLNTRNATWQNVVWKVDLREFPAGVGGGGYNHMKHFRTPGGLTRIRAVDGNGYPIGNIGLAGRDTIILQRHDNLIAVQAMTGEIVWSRKDLAPGCELFGDAELLLAVPPNATEARVFRAADGTELGACAVASESKRVATLDRRIITYSRTGGQNTLALIDPWAKETVWSVVFERGTQIWNYRQEMVAAMEPSGRFRLFHMADGKTAVDQMLEPEPRMDGILVLPGQNQYLLITHHEAPQTSTTATIAAVPGEPTDPPLLTGKVYAFDSRTGLPQWPTPATIEHRGLRFPQHPALPALIFVQNVMRKDSEDDGKTSVMCLDKRTGQMLYRNDTLRFTPRSNFDYQAEGNPEKQTITIALPNSTITLKVTDQPLPPEPPEQESARIRHEQKAKGFFGVLGSTMKAFGTPPGGSEPASDDLFGTPDPAAEKSEPAEEEETPKEDAPAPE